MRVIYSAFAEDAYTASSPATLSLGNLARPRAPDLIFRPIAAFFERLLNLIYSVLLGVLALFLFALYFSEKEHPEYLWLALHELAAAPLVLSRHSWRATTRDLALFSAQRSFSSSSSSLLSLFRISRSVSLSQAAFWYIRALRYTSPSLLGISPALLFLFHRGAIPYFLAIFISCGLWMIGWCIFVFGTLISAAVRRNFEAGLFLIPMGFSVVAILDTMIGNAMNGGTSTPYISPLTIQAGPIPFRISAVGGYAGILVIVLIVFFRYRRVQRDKEHATNELAAARGVQELLIPQEKLATPGFEVDSIYSPASEVGGDFFHVQTMGRSDLLVVIGDVAGHGLKAAMNVSLIMGALRRMQDASPSRILQGLNRVLSGTDSFTTCRPLWFGPIARWSSPTPVTFPRTSTARNPACLAASRSASLAKLLMTSRAFSFTTAIASSCSPTEWLRLVTPTESYSASTVFACSARSQP